MQTAETQVLDPASVDVVVLCGGLGSRLGSMVREIPKPMIPVCGRPFLDLLLETFSQAGFRRFILCTGYKAQVVADYYRSYPAGMDVRICKEERPLGTAGALRDAAGLIRSQHLVVTNGDSLCRMDLPGLVTTHINTGALLTMAVWPTVRAQDCGTVVCGGDSRILAFIEKGCYQQDHLVNVNAGVYAMNRRLLDLIPKAIRCSLEYDVFPGLLRDHLCMAYTAEGPLLDIGTPERLQHASRLLADQPWVRLSTPHVR